MSWAYEIKYKPHSDAKEKSEEEESISFRSNMGEESLFLWDSWGGEEHNKWQRGPENSVVLRGMYYYYFYCIPFCKWTHEWKEESVMPYMHEKNHADGI